MKIFFSLLISILQITSADSQVEKKLKGKLQVYFRILPYNKDFKNWTEEIEHDSIYYIDSLSKNEKDSMHVIFKGTAFYQPFNILKNYVNFLVQKSVIALPVFHRTDTLNYFFIYVTLDFSFASKQIIINEYKRLNKEFRRFFTANNEMETKEGKEIISQRNNYMMGKLSFTPSLIISWYKDSYNKNYIIGMNIPFKVN